MKKLIVMLVMVSVVVFVGSCNMMRGAGQDIQEAGTAVEKAAN